MPERPVPLRVPILLGVIGRPHGVHGLVRVTSHTADPAALTGYGPLFDPSERWFTLRWVGEGIAEIAEVVDGKPVKIADRTAAERLTNTKLFIERDRLPAPEADEYYLADLIGLAAVDAGGAPVGTVTALHDYGAGASLEIARDQADSLLVPFTAACVPEVNIAAGRVTVVSPDEIAVPETADPPRDASTSAGHGPGEASHPNLGRHVAMDSPLRPEDDGSTPEDGDCPPGDAGCAAQDAGQAARDDGDTALAAFGARAARVDAAT